MKHENSIGIELEYVNMLPIWNECGSNNYTKLTVNQIDMMYKDLDYSNLMTIRTNKGVD